MKNLFSYISNKISKNNLTLSLFSSVVLAFLVSTTPAFVLAASVTAAPSGAIVPCNVGCGWNDLIQLGQNVMVWAIYFVGLASVVSITYAGWLYLSANGNSGQIGKAHAVFGKVITGIIITLAAWLIVKSILGWIGLSSNDFSLLN